MTVGAHYDAWQRQRDRADAYESAFGGNDPGWAIVFRFYAALHLTQGYLETKASRFDAKNHAERKKAIAKSPELRRNFRESFEDLKDLSENVRYDPEYVATAADYENTAKWLKTVESFLKAKVKAYVDKAT